MNIRLITEYNIPMWEKLLLEHDCYIKEVSGASTEWYEINIQSPSYKKYMESIITKKKHTWQ